MQPSVHHPDAIDTSQSLSKAKSPVRALVQALVRAARARRDLRREANARVGDPRNSPRTRT